MSLPFLTLLLLPNLVLGEQLAPAIVFSYNLAPGIRQLYEGENSSSVVTEGQFLNIAEQLISQCHSHTYVFVNQPGLRSTDFKHYKHSMHHLYNYVHTSSTALGFKVIEMSQEEQLSDILISYAKEACTIDETVLLEGNVTNRYTPFVEARTRVINVNFPRLPQKGEVDEEQRTRRDVLMANDEYLRYILGTLPSPRHTVFYLSTYSEEFESPGHEDFWPEIFNDPRRKVDTDRNDRVSKELPTFIPYRPRIQERGNEPLRLDPKFIEDNYNLIFLIVSSSVAFLAFQLIQRVLRKSPKPTVTQEKKKQ